MKRFSAVMTGIILVLATLGIPYADYAYTSLNYPYSQHTMAYGINDEGTIVGYGVDSSGRSVAFFSSDLGETYIRLDSYYLPIFPESSWAYDIANGGTIVGSYQYEGMTYGFYSLEEDGNYFDYTTLTYPGGLTYAYGINDEGTIVGSYYDGARWHGFSLSEGTYKSLDYPGGQNTRAYGINNGGMIVGQYSDESGTHGFFFSGGAYTPLNYPGAFSTHAYGINDEGTIVGQYTDGTGEHGFSLSGTTYALLNYPGATDTVARGINNGGMIVGRYNDESGTHGFIATPLSIPGDFAPADCDVDGSDLAALIANPSLLDIPTFAQNFGKNVCP
jgi:uncharacterized membrane protein